jgi:glutathione synthase/RimK-type ligase-like ATP-grasp enzyme
MKKLLIITTVNDLSIPLFLVNDVVSCIDVEFCFFHEDIEVIKTKIEATQFDYVYIKDPFTSPYQEDDLKNKLNFIINNENTSYLIDNINTIKDVYFEDKLLQYKLFSDFMPKTKIFSEYNNEFDSNYIIKKRISSRGKGIIFNKEDVSKNNSSNYIIQEQIIIDKEYRIYVIFNEIVDIVSIKTSKTQTSKIEVVNTEEINSELKMFVQKVIVNNKFDLIGLDVAFSQGKYYLIEINRSPQFTAFYNQTKTNLAELFVKRLLKKKAYHEE